MILNRARLRPNIVTIGQPTNPAPLTLVQKTERKPSRRVLVHGLVYFGEVLADFMTGDGTCFQYYPDRGLLNLMRMANELRHCDLVYQIGGRVNIGKFLRAARLFGKRRIVMHWIGSDVLEQRDALAAGKLDPWVLNNVLHWADSKWIAREVSALGVSCELVPLPSARIPESPSPMPRQFCVLVYMPSIESSELYGLDIILEVARQLPAIRFEMVGLREGVIPDPPANLTVHRRIPNLAEFYKRASVVWRPTRHDGLSWMVCEALGHGRHVLWSYPFPGCIHVTSASDASAQISKLYRSHQENGLQMNHAGASFIAESEYHPQSFREKIRSRIARIIES